MTHHCEFVRRASAKPRIAREALLDDVLSHTIEVVRDEEICHANISRLTGIFQSSSLRDIFAAAATAPPPLPRPV